MIDEETGQDIEDNGYTMSDGELVQACMDEISNSLQGNDGDEDISLPLDYYYGKKPGLVACKDPKATAIISMDLHDAVEASVAEIIPAFGGGDVAQFEPESAQDEEQAKAESDICNYLFMERYNGLSVLVTGLKDCFLNRNSYAKVFWDRHKEVHFESYEMIDETYAAQLMQPRSEGETVDVVSHEEVPPPPEVQQQHEQMMQQFMQVEQQYMQAMAMGMPPGQPPQEPQPPAFFNVTLRRTTIKSGPVIRSVAPENALISDSTDEVTLENSRFSAHRDIVSKSDLVARGYDEDIVMDLPVYQDDASYARNRDGDSSGYQPDGAAAQVEVFECFIDVDRDGDNIAETRRVVISNNILLDDAEWDMTDMVAGATCIAPHQHEGVSMYDIMKDIQNAKTDMLRSVVDGAALAARQRLEATDDVNYDDLLSASRGGVVRSKRIGSVAQLPNPEIPPTVYSSMEMLDKVRRERGGSAVDSSVQTTQIGGDSAHGIERVMSSIELTNAMVARTFADTFVRGIFLRLHSLIRKYSRGEISAKIDGQWISSDPAQWPQRERVSIKVGNSQGERQRMAGALQQIQGVQMTMLQQQMPTITPDKLYESSVDMANYMGVPNPEQYFVDPMSEEGQQLAAQQQQQQQMMQQKTEENEQFQKQLMASQAQAQTQLAQAEMGKVQAQHQNNMLKHQIDQLEQQLKQAEAGASVRLQSEKLDRETAMDLLEMEQKAKEQLDKEYQQNKQVA